ncbi:hypothetical protein HPB47_021609 [Ixodes persulcatus]|uniref:Uncharacterized protein n=1 Tax=Ixodes persulcatus TaxID=34615 RepID=A0AC60QCC8_IXOPE|nr:hypothetical protein HPB47_021609 [Ixodes persulcatus]
MVAEEDEACVRLNWIRWQRRAQCFNVRTVVDPLSSSHIGGGAVLAHPRAILPALVLNPGVEEPQTANHYDIRDNIQRHQSESPLHRHGSAKVKAITKRRLPQELQQSNESFTAYMKDVLTLCRRSNPKKPEAERSRHLLKGIAEEAFTLFTLQPPTTVTAIVDAFTRLQEARQQPAPSSEEPQRSFVFNPAVAYLTSAQAPPLTPWRQDQSYQQPYRQRQVCYYCGIMGHVAHLCRRQHQDNEPRYHYDSYQRSSRRDNSWDYDDEFRDRRRRHSPSSETYRAPPTDSHRRRSPSPHHRSLSAIIPRSAECLHPGN